MKELELSPGAEKRTYRRAWYAKNRERVRAMERDRQRMVYADNPQACLEKQRRWIAANRERAAELQRLQRRKKPWVTALSNARGRAKKSGIPYSLTLEWAESMWTGKCVATGAEFRIGVGKRGSYSPSVDRIDSSLGYSPENCRFVLWAINRFKSDATDAEMLDIARLLVAQATC